MYSSDLKSRLEKCFLQDFVTIELLLQSLGG